jgi:hypothetical protein
MIDDFELTNDLSDKETKRLLHKLRSSASGNSNCRLLKNTGCIIRLKTIYKKALRNKFVMVESSKKRYE